jgi:phosphoglycolate phosphatase
VAATPIRAVLFDKDGTLFEFAASWRGVVEAILDRLAGADDLLRGRLGAIGGYDVAAGRFSPGSPIVVGATDEIAALWAPMLPGMTARQIEHIANEAARTIGGPQLAPATDLPALLDGLRGRGLALGVATHDAEVSARRHLSAVGALDHFDFVAGYDSGWGLKPGPGMVLAFAGAAQVDPAEIVMVGDSVHDRGAARAAGAAAVAVLTGPAGPDDLAPHADAVLASIAELPAWLDARRVMESTRAAPRYG